MKIYTYTPYLVKDKIRNVYETTLEIPEFELEFYQRYSTKAPDFSLSQTHYIIYNDFSNGWDYLPFQETTNTQEFNENEVMQEDRNDVELKVSDTQEDKKPVKRKKRKVEA